MIKTNSKRLVEIAVQGTVAPPMRFDNFEMDSCGVGHSVPSVGGITYNVKLGDSAFGWAGDHIEPGVSLVMDIKDRSSKHARAFQFLSCVGNRATVVSGAAKGRSGIVAGHHGGVEHLIVDFDDSIMNNLVYGDKILIRSFGQGLEFLDFPDIRCYNFDPNLLKHWKISSDKTGALTVPVAAIVPSSIMGSGIGHADPGSGDYDITTQDPAMIKKYNLECLRFGDFVAIQDADNTYGRNYYGGAMTIGIVIHSDSYLSGHGPGVTTLLSTRKKNILKPVVQKKNSNLADILKIGRSKAGSKK